MLKILVKYAPYIAGGLLILGVGILMIGVAFIGGLGGEPLDGNGYSMNGTYGDGTAGSPSGFGTPQLTASGGSGKVADFKQCDSNWKGLIISGFSSHPSMCRAGCALTALADALVTFGVQTDPGKVVTMANQMHIANQIRGSGGTPATLAKKYGLHWVQLPAKTGWNQAMDYLKKGAVVIQNSKGGPPPSSAGGHYFVLAEYNSDSTITVHDPARRGTPVKYSEALLRSEAPTYGGYITVIYK